MTPIDRREFLFRTLAAGGGLIAGCGDDPLSVVDMSATDAGLPNQDSDLGLTDFGLDDVGAATDSGALADMGAGSACTNPFEGGARLGRAPFTDRVSVPLDRAFNEGWDGRLYTDLSNLDEDSLIIPNDTFYIRTRYPDLLTPPTVWTIEVDGLAAPATLSLNELLPLVQPMGTHVLECSGNGRGGAFGLLSAATWAGIPMSTVLDRIDIDASATRVLVSGFDEHSVPSAGGHSTPGASWIFTFDQLEQSGAFLATEMNGEPLPPDHGEPVRLFVPNWYGCTCIKWVDRISLVDESAPATSQMQEFWSRTHQTRRFEMARDYSPATLDQAAMPIRVEKWRVGGEVLYQVVGIMWGGSEPTDALSIRFNEGPPLLVEVCPRQTQNDTWTLWRYAWRPPMVGRYEIRMTIEDPGIPTQRLDTAFYRRTINIDEV